MLRFADFDMSSCSQQFAPCSTKYYWTPYNMPEQCANPAIQMIEPDSRSPERQEAKMKIEGLPSLRQSQKREQVKRACNNCRKACKKCDSSRPCVRCTKFRMEDTCIDSGRRKRHRSTLSPAVRDDQPLKPTSDQLMPALRRPKLTGQQCPGEVGRSHTKLSLLSWVCNILSTQIAEQSSYVCRTKTPGTPQQCSSFMSHEDLIAARILRSLSTSPPVHSVRPPAEDQLINRNATCEPAPPRIQDVPCAPALCCRSRPSPPVYLPTHHRVLLLP